MTACNAAMAQLISDNTAAHGEHVTERPQRQGSKKHNPVLRNTQWEKVGFQSTLTLYTTITDHA